MSLLLYHFYPYVYISRNPSETAIAVAVGFRRKNEKPEKLVAKPYTLIFDLIKVIPQDQRAREPLQQHPDRARRVGGRNRPLSGQRGRDSIHGRFVAPTEDQGVTFCLLLSFVFFANI